MASSSAEVGGTVQRIFRYCEISQPIVDLVSSSVAVHRGNNDDYPFLKSPLGICFGIPTNQVDSTGKRGPFKRDF